ncbi:hypothetical protein, partial [Limnohabitans sp. 2KL-51]|uniref:hypothetical protein n=1 Tax=Limnohabitans sp. 2KL-51 TaxID=1977911 RepID=UPI000DD1AAA8
DTASSSTTIANNGTTTNALSSVKGTGLAGNTIFLYDNNYTTLVGSAVVDGTGNWSVTSLTGTFGGSNTFAAKQVDAQGNHSGLSNLWTVTAPGGTSLIDNGDFSAGSTGFTTELNNSPGGVFNSSDNYRITTVADANSAQTYTTTIATSAATTPVTYGSGLGTWSKASVGGTWQGAVGNPDGTMTGNIMQGQISTGTKVVWGETANVVAGQTYKFTLDYQVNAFTQGANPKPLNLTIDGVTIDFVSQEYEAGHLTVTYTAPTTKAISLSIQGNNGNASGGDFLLDNISFAQVAPTNTLGTTGAGSGPTENPDGTLSYTAGALDALGSNDTITVGNTSLQATLAAGGIINGGTGIDNLKLAAGTTLNLESTTGNQTVRPIEQVEMITLQGAAPRC